MHVKQYSSLGHAIFDRLGNSGRKDPDTMFTRKKKSGSETSVFERSTFGSVFEKLRFGARAFSKSSGYVRIRRVTVSMYPGSKSSVFEKTRIRVHVALAALSMLTKTYKLQTSDVSTTHLVAGHASDGQREKR